MQVFDEYRQGVQEARFEDFFGLEGVMVRSEQNFEEMRRYLLELYDGYQVVGSVLVGEDVFDCLSAYTQPMVEIDGDCPDCPEGSIPLRRISLEELVRFPTLQASFKKFIDVQGKDN